VQHVAMYGYRRFEGNWCLFLPESYSPLKIEAVFTLETEVNINHKHGVTSCFDSFNFWCMIHIQDVRNIVLFLLFCKIIFCETYSVLSLISTYSVPQRGRLAALNRSYIASKAWCLEIMPQKMASVNIIQVCAAYQLFGQRRTAYTLVVP
jgi:hypothetical protein